MERKIIFKHTATGEELVMPVTPPSYQIEHGRKQNTATLLGCGDVSTPGPAVLLDEEQEFLLPAQRYPFAQPGSSTNPFVYIEKLEKWSDAGDVLRYVVAGTPINAAVRFGPIRYQEKDGTNDVYVTVPIRGVRVPAVQSAAYTTSSGTARAVETDPVKTNSYTVVPGNTLSGICRRFYGTISLTAALGAYNNIKNINLIYPRQVIALPSQEVLKASTATFSASGKVGRS